MITSSKLLLILAVLLTSLLPAASQSPENIGLTLNGTVSSVSQRDTSDKASSDKSAEWTYKLLMVFRNDGNQPVILYKPCFEDNKLSCEAKIDFLYQGDLSDTGSNNQGERPLFSQKNLNRMDAIYWPQLIQGLNQARPPRSLTVTIDPGGTYEFVQTFVVKRKFLQKADQKQKVIDRGISDTHGDSKILDARVSEASALRITYRFTPMEPDGNIYEEGTKIRPYRDADLLANLSEHWRAFGIFPVDSSGSFSITSERIINGMYQKPK